MSLVVFDIESTGLYNFKRPPSDQTQPRVIQLGAIMVDSRWEEINMMATVIRPEGWVSNRGAREAHGISERRCELFGARIKAALALFMDFVRSAGEVASYNLPFDEGLIDVELDRLGAKPQEWKRGGMKRTCIMDAAAQRYNSGISMKLPAAHAAATGIVYQPTHRSLPDARAALRILREIRR